MKTFRTSKRTRGIAGGLAVAAIVTGAWLAWQWVQSPVHHFATVTPGKVYRSGQPGALSWRMLRHHYGIATVVSLREDEPDAAWERQEQAFCRDHGMKLVRVQLQWPQPTREQVLEILAVMTDPARQPVLVHCEAGSVRTGVVIAAYRIVAEGWSLEAAMAEARTFGHSMQPGYVAFLTSLDRDSLLAHTHGRRDTGGNRQ